LHINWKARNDDLHGVDSVSREAALLVVVKQEITALYTLRNQVLPRDRELFYSSLEEHFTQDPTSRGLRQWVLTWQPVILRSVKDSSRLNVSRTRSIRSFFSQVIPRLLRPSSSIPSTL
jgi:hypothetical protein